MTQTQSEFNNNSTSSPLYVRSSSQSQETSTNKILLTPSPIKSRRSEIFGTTTPLTVPDTQININDIPQTIQESQFIEETQNEINTKKRLRSGKDIEINRKKRNIEIYKAPDNDDDAVYSMNEISSTQKKLNILKNKNDNKVIDPFASIPQKRKTDDEDTSFSSENFVYPKPKLIKYNKNNNKKINDIIVDVVEEKEEEKVEEEKAEEKKVEEKKTEIVKNKEIIKNNRIYKKNKSDMIEQDSPDNIIIIPMLKLSVESQGKKFQKVFHKQKQTKINLI